MKKLDIDLELLVQSFSFNEDDLAKEYLDTETGEIINVPISLANMALANISDENLEDWQKELLVYAYAIKDDNLNRYIEVPTIESTYFYNALVDFCKNEVSDTDMKEELCEALKTSQSMRDLKSILFTNENELDKWQDYEETKYEEYAINWLKTLGIELLHIEKHS